MAMLVRVGGLSKMTDNPAVADSVGSNDESLPALLSATAPMAWQAASNRFSEALRYAVCCAAGFVGCRSLLSQVFWLLRCEPFDVS